MASTSFFPRPLFFFRDTTRGFGKRYFYTRLSLFVGYLQDGAKSLGDPRVGGDESAWTRAGKKETWGERMIERLEPYHGGGGSHHGGGGQGRGEARNAIGGLFR